MVLKPGVVVAKCNFVDRKGVENFVNLVQNATEIRRQARYLWDAVVDLQDQVATLASLLEAFEPIPEDAVAWVYRPGMEPERVNLVDYAKEVLACAD